MSSMNLSMTIGAMLAGSFRSTVGQAMRGIGDMERGMEGLQRRLLDFGQAAGTLYGLNKLRLKAENEEDQLGDIGLTAGMAAEQVETLRQSLRRLSAKSETNQSMDQLIRAYQTLASTGLTDRITDQRQMETILRTVGRTAKASNADIDDMAKTAFILVDTLGVAPENLSAELDRLAFAGKKGSFELKDMSKAFPTLGAAAKEAGVTGTEAVTTMAASLQIARKAAGSSDEAANNMKNFLATMMSPEVMKNFKERNIDVVKVMSQAIKNGENPIEAMLKQTDALLGNDLVKRKARLGALFGDMQVQDFIRPMLAQAGDYKKLKAEILDAKGTVDADYATKMGLAKAQSDAFGNAMDKAGRSIGRAFLPPIMAVQGALTPMIEGLANVIDRSPGTTLAVAGIGTAMLVLPPALRLGAFALRMFGTANVAAAGSVGVFSTALRLNPIGLIVSGVALAAGVIYDNWDWIKKTGQGIWDDVRPHWEAFAAFISDWATVTLAPIRAVIELGAAAGNFAMGKGFDLSGVKAVGSDALAAGGRVWDRVPKEYQRPDFGIMDKTGGAMPKAGDALAAAEARTSAAMGGRGNLAGAGAPVTGQIDVNVNLSNLPRGATVSAEARGSAVGDFDTRTGYQMEGP